MEQNFQQNKQRTSHPLRWPENIEKEIEKIKIKLLHFPIKEIARCLEHNNIIFKCAGIRALSDRKEAEYVQALLRLIDKKVNKLIRLESVVALGKIQDEEAIYPLKKILYY
ncbi:MAG: HEAT repeat domain-containing protein [Vampirovibrionia bacterium]